MTQPPALANPLEKIEPFPERAPAGLLLLAAIVGIYLDRSLQPPWVVWILALGSCVAFSLLAAYLRHAGSRVQNGHRSAAILLACTAAWGGWHHLWWSDPPPNHIYHLSTPTGRLITLNGIVADSGWVRTRRSEMKESLWDVDCQGWIDRDSQIVPAPGRVRVICADPQLIEQPERWLVGERQSLTGRLIRPADASNPEAFDYRRWLRSQRVEAILRIDHLASVVSQPETPTLLQSLKNWRVQLRRNAIDHLQAGTDSVTATVAEALLLGTRSSLPEELRQSFVASGLLHVLAISGMNVGILWWSLMRLCCGTGISYRTSSALVMLGLLGYAWLTDANPPIVRATVFAIALQAAGLLNRPMGLLQGLSLAAVIVLIVNPTDLFNAGAQLSFLAVATLAVIQRLWQSWQSEGGWLFRDSQPAPWYHLPHVWEKTWRYFLQSGLLTGAIWFVTAPLVASRFHFLSPIGLILGVVTSPLILVLLWAGYAWLLVLAIVPPLSPLFLLVFTTLLRLLMAIAIGGSQWLGGQLYLIGPPPWWVLGFYAALALAFVRPGLWKQWWWKGSLVWLNAGLLWLLIPTAPQGLVCDVLSVGHGLAVVIRGPAGQTLVYDVGSLSGGAIAAEAVAQSLWQAGHCKIDALVLSHADADHCNGVEELVKRVQPGLLLFHSSLENNSFPTPRQMIATWKEAGGITRPIIAGEQIDWDPAVRIDVWQPRMDSRYSSDNANSVVLAVGYAGRTILLTGDLEKEGLEDLLRRPRTPVDVLIAPHHGGLASNTAEFGAWTNPAWVAISSSSFDVVQRLKQRYPSEAVLLNTATSGRIRFSVALEGDLAVSVFRKTIFP